jgi:SNF2 family DNA or RNA helicase
MGGVKLTKPTKTLDDYQFESRDFLLSHNFRCLFDEPGVGKTGPSIMAGWHALQKDNHEDGGSYNSVLITVPAYLIPNWKKEIHAFLPMATVVSADGAGSESRSEALSSGADFVLTSYHNWGAKDRDGKPRYPVLVDRKWSAYIFDEGHRLRGRNSAWTQQVFRTRLTRSKNRNTPIWILTGTPFVRDGGDFFPYFHLYDSKRFGSYWGFVNNRCVIIETPFAKKIGNIRKSVAEEFRRELAEFSLRRTVRDVPQLAALEFTEQDYSVILPASVVSMIKKAKKEYVLDHPDLASPEFLNGSGALYVAQRRLATNPPTKVKPKVDWLKDFLADKKGKVVVYVWYKESAKLVADSLGDNGVLVTGDVPPAKRDAIVDKWRSKVGPQVLVATIPSLKEGISLTEARDVVFLEHSELPADQEQCIKRLCRRGQQDLVQVHHVWAAKSVDVAIKRVLDNRNLGIQEALAKWIADEDTEDDWFV